MSPVFPAGECKLRISVYQSAVNGIEYLSMCLESKVTEKSSSVLDRSCWCLFRLSVLNQKPGPNHMHRDSYGRSSISMIKRHQSTLSNGKEPNPRQGRLIHVTLVMKDFLVLRSYSILRFTIGIFQLLCLLL